MGIIKLAEPKAIKYESAEHLPSTAIYAATTPTNAYGCTKDRAIDARWTNAATT